MLKQVRSRARTLLQRASHGQAETDLDAALSRLDALRLALRRKVFSRALISSAVIALMLCVVVLTGSYLELGYVLRYLSLAGLSVVGMAGAWLFGGSCILALLWLGLYLRNLDAEGGVHRFRCQRVLTLANRSVGHVEVLLSWWLLVCMNTTRASLQLVALGCLLLAPAGFDFVVLRQVGARLRGYGDVLWLRRPYFYAATLAAMGAISVQGGYRAFPWWSLVLWALALGIRFLAWVAWVQRSWLRAKRRWNSPSPANRDERMRSKLRASEAKRARWWDPVLVAVGVVIAFLVPWLLVLSSGSGKGELAKRYQERPAGSVGRSPNTLGLFLVADNQFHELGGRRTGGSLSLVEAVVSVASRPIALDLLSGASFEQLRTRYQALDAPELGWAHLGDIGDLGCEGELGRMGRFFERMGYDGMLGVAVGNHDLYFTGNFAWHPDWAGHACEASSVLSREQTLDRLRELPSPRTKRFLDQSIPGEDGFFSRLVRLGKVGGREIVGVFLDTSNYGWWNLGLAGLQGGISDSQVDWIETALSNHADAHVIVFQHHPLDELVLGARTLNVDPMLEHLGSRLIAIVSAHTHLSTLREHDIGGRSVPEFIVGSTTDAPQEGALLEIGPNPTTLRLTLIPTVTLAEIDPVSSAVTSPYEVPLSAQHCQRVFETMTDAACQRMRRQSPKDRRGLDPESLFDSETKEAADVAQCVFGEQGKRLAEPLSRYAQDRMDEWMFENPELRQRAACVAWAAGTLQQHKHRGCPRDDSPAPASWSLGDAMQHAAAHQPPTTRFEWPRRSAQ